MLKLLPLLLKTNKWSLQFINSDANQNLLPNQHLVDRGYTSARLITQSERDYQIDLFGPVGTNGGWQARAGAQI